MKTKERIGHTLLSISLILSIIFFFNSGHVSNIVLGIISSATVVVGLVLTKKSTKYLKFIKSDKIITVFGKKKSVKIYEQKKRGTFKQIFDSISKNTEELSVQELNAFVNENNLNEVIKEYIQEYFSFLRKGSNLLLVNSGKNFFVVRVRVFDSGSHEVLAYYFKGTHVWDVSEPRHIIVPQLTA